MEKTYTALKPINAAVKLLLGVGAFASLSAHAYETRLGNYDLSINSTVSVGTAWRVQGQDTKLYARSNNREGDQEAVNTPTQTPNGLAAVPTRTNGEAPSSTTDDGNLNFNAGDRFTTIIKGVHDFDLAGENHGFFARVKWFYDYTLNNENVYHGHAPNGYARNSELNDSNFHEYAKFDGVNLLDAFGYLNTEVNGMPLDLRLGRQVIGWGESTLIFSPISGINTLDLSALRRPGVDLKEAFTPSEVATFNLGVTDDTSLEGFYQLKWRKTVTEGCGTYFASNDIAADGCNFVTIAAAPAPNPPFAAGGAVFFPDRASFAGAVGVSRSPDSKPSDSGQFGLALRKYSTELDTEFGFYYMNYHSRLPMISARKGGAGALERSAFANPAGGTYVIEYPEDISIFGLSAATNIGGWAVSGEISHARDVPVQLNTVDILVGVLQGAPTTFGRRFAAANQGDLVAGYDKFDVTQVQSTLIRTFDRALGSDTIVFLGEVGANFVSSLPKATQAITDPRYGRSPVFGTAYQSGLSEPSSLGTDGFVTDFSWGYRLRLRGVYQNAIGGIDLVPTISWSHDVKGWSPEPGQAFNEGRKSLGLGLGFDFNANQKASVNYVTFADSADYDVFRDRDFVSVNYSHSF